MYIYIYIYIYVCIYSFLISFWNSLHKFNGDILRLVFPFAAFVASGVGSDAGCNGDSNDGSRVGILSKFLIGNNLLLKLLRTFSLGRQYYFTLSKFFN